MQIIKDQTGYEMKLNKPVKRIVSLVPSHTELLIDLVGVEKVVGRTKFCIYPKVEVSNIPVIGGTKQFSFEKIEELAPDLIIANKEENYKEGVELLREKCPVWTSDIFNLADNYEMITAIGNLIDAESKASHIIKQTKTTLSSVQNTKRGSVLYFIWQKPYMVVGKETFIDHLLTHLGYENQCLTTRYPEMDLDKLSALNPDFVFLSSEPFPFQKQHLQDFQKIFPTSKIVLVDGEMFSWYGSRLLSAGDYFFNQLPT